MDDKRNLILAVSLSIVILLGWNALAGYFFPEQATSSVESSQQSSAPAPALDSDSMGGSDSASSDDTLGAPSGDFSTSSNGGFANLADSGLTPPTADAPILITNMSARIAIETPTLVGSINLIGARLDDLTLTKYREELGEASPNVRLFAPESSGREYYASLGWISASPQIAVPNLQTRWQATGDRLTPTSPVRLSWSNESGQIFHIDYSIDENYLITARQSVTNTAETPVQLASHSYINRRGLPENQSTFNVHIGPMGVFNGVADYDWDYEDVSEAPNRTVQYDSVGGWLGFTDKYWLAAIVPEADSKITAAFRAGNRDIYQSNFVRAPDVVAAGQTQSHTSRIFAGAKEVNVLKDYQAEFNIALFDRAIDWGWFYWFEVPIFSLLYWLFNWSGNFGVAIMIMTLIIRVLMFPIAQKQFRSMAQMRLIQPKMKALQDRYKDDKQRLSQEMMSLYKEEKVNPLAGCLPLLLQIPIFYALYKVLILTIEMRHQPFVLWIEDLSAPDPLHIINLFGLLPFSPPAFLGVGILAVLLGVTMWLQFRLNPTPTDPVQQQVFAIMPWLMMFIMAPFASGLLVYWITNNVLTIAQQRWLYSRYPALKMSLTEVSEVVETNKSKANKSAAKKSKAK